MPFIAEENKRSNGAAARLRADIDSGRTGEKVDWPDPAAAPLGTDEEAAGTPADEHAIEQARAAECAFGAPASQQSHGPGAAWILIVIIVLAAAGLIALAAVA
jgi:hypothetical protein